MPRAPAIVKEHLTNGTKIEFRLANHEQTAWEWYTGTVVNWKQLGNGGVEHEINWNDPRWPDTEWRNLSAAEVVWRIPKAAARPAPVAAPQQPPATLAPAPATSKQEDEDAAEQDFDEAAEDGNAASTAGVTADWEHVNYAQQLEF